MARGAGSAAGPGKLARFRECLAGDRAWEKDLLLDTLHWMRQIIALVMGVAWGALPMTGPYPFLAFVITAFGSAIVFCRAQGIDEDEFGGLNILMQEGMAPALSLFVLMWVCVYSTLHN